MGKLELQFHNPDAFLVRGWGDKNWKKVRNWDPDILMYIETMAVTALAEGTIPHSTNAFFLGGG